MANSIHETAVSLWLQCSRSCGGGFQRRQVLCKQRLADGSILELPDTFCPSRSPASQQTCARMDCPPQWVTTDWSQVGYSVLIQGGGNWICTVESSYKSHKRRGWAAMVSCSGMHLLIHCIIVSHIVAMIQCSVTCGNGIQRLQTVCMKQAEDGRLLTMDPENCSLIAQPTRIRPCSLRLCEGKRSLSAWMDCAILNNYECVNETK